MHRYEAVFYTALALVLVAWILFENTLLFLSKREVSSTTSGSLEDKIVLEHGNRWLQLSDLRIPLIFVSRIFSALTALLLLRSFSGMTYSKRFLFFRWCYLMLLSLELATLPVLQVSRFPQSIGSLQSSE